MALFALCLVGIIGTAWFIERQIFRKRESAIKYRAYTELVSWMRCNADALADDGLSQRNVNRARIICDALKIGYGTVSFAIILPNSIGTEETIELPCDVRQALVLRHARWDGEGISPIAGDEIPIAAQVLSVIDWLAVRDYTPTVKLIDEISKERGKKFAPEVTDAVIRNIIAIVDAERPIVQSNFRIVNGAIVVCRPEKHGPIAQTAMAIRRALRPNDQVKVINDEVIMWLRDTSDAGVKAVLHRIATVLYSMPSSSIDKNSSIDNGNNKNKTKQLSFGVALAGLDSNKFADLIKIARSRVK